MGLISPRSVCSLFQSVILYHSLLLCTRTSAETNGCNRAASCGSNFDTLERRFTILLPRKHPTTMSPSTLRCTSLQGPGCYPFIWVSLSPSISIPTLFSAGLARGQGYMGGMGVEVTLQRGSWKHCGTLPRNQRKEGMEGEWTLPGDISYSTPF